MTLIDQYLRAVALLLPKEKREDIVSELRELILSKIEAREGELGRSLTEDEIEAVLREIGHPLVVASRYRDGPQHVVGPTLYPYWVFAVKAAIALQIVIAGIVFLVRALSGDVARAFGQAIGSAFTGAMVLIGIATVAAWLLERRIIRFERLDHWRVRDLGYLEFASWDGGIWSDWIGAMERWAHTANGPEPTPRPAPATAAGPAAPPPGAAPSPADPYYWGKRGRRRLRRAYRYAWGWRRSSTISRGLGSVAFAVVLILWWVGVIRFGIASGPEDFRAIGIEPGGLAGFDWAALKTSLYVPVVAYAGLVMVQGVARITHPAGIRMHGLFDMAIAALVFATVVWLWNNSPLSGAVRVDTIAAFVRRMREGFENGPPFALAPILTLALVIVGFGAVSRAIRGFFEATLPTPWLGYGPYPSPV